MRKTTLLLLLAALLAQPALATVPSESSYATATGNGATTVFTFTFAVTTSSSDVRVFLNGVQQGAGYTVALNANQTASPGGTVTFTVAPANGVAVKIQRTVALTQPSAFSAYGPYRAKDVEKGLDRLAYQTQQVDRRVADAEATHAADKAAQDARDNGQDLALAQGAVGGNDTFITATGSTTARKEKDRWADVVNVMDFGAYKDGTHSTQTTQAFKDAIAAAPWGAAIRVPAGSYAINDQLDLTAYSLIGDGARNTTIAWDESANGTGKKMIRVWTNFSSIRDIQIAGPTSANVTPPDACVWFNAGGAWGTSSTRNGLSKVIVIGTGWAAGSGCTVGVLSDGTSPTEFYRFEYSQIYGRSVGLRMNAPNSDYWEIDHCYLGNLSNGGTGLWVTSAASAAGLTLRNVWFTAPGADTTSIALHVQGSATPLFLENVGAEGSTFAAFIQLASHVALYLTNTGFDYYIPLVIKAGSAPTIFGHNIGFSYNSGLPKATGSGIRFPDGAPEPIYMFLDGKPPSGRNLFENAYGGYSPVTWATYKANGIYSAAAGTVVVGGSWGYPTDGQATGVRESRAVQLAPMNSGGSGARLGPALILYGSVPEDGQGQVNWTDNRTGALRVMQTYDPTVRIFDLDTIGGAIYQSNQRFYGGSYARSDAPGYMFGRSNAAPTSDAASTYVVGDVLLNTDGTGGAALGWRARVGGVGTSSQWDALYTASNVGSITLTSGTPSTGTATVRSGALCICTNATTQANPIKCAVSGTTLTATGPNTVTDSVTYACF